MAALSAAPLSLVSPNSLALKFIGAFSSMAVLESVQST
jgi:hypothetical protein